MKNPRNISLNLENVNRYDVHLKLRILYINYKSIKK